MISVILKMDASSSASFFSRVTVCLPLEKMFSC